MKRFLIIILAVLLVSLIMGPAVLAADPPDPTLDVDITVTGDNPDVDVSMNGDNPNVDITTSGDNAQVNVNGAPMVNDNQLSFIAYWADQKSLALEAEVASLQTNLDSLVAAINSDNSEFGKKTDDLYGLNQEQHDYLSLHDSAIARLIEEVQYSIDGLNQLNTLILNLKEQDNQQKADIYATLDSLSAQIDTLNGEAEYHLTLINQLMTQDNNTRKAITQAQQESEQQDAKLKEELKRTQVAILLASVILLAGISCLGAMFIRNIKLRLPR